MPKKKQASRTKNRRDEHGVYERRAYRGKAAFPTKDRDEREASGARGRRPVKSQGAGRTAGARPSERYGKAPRPNDRGRGFAEEREERNENLLIGRNPVTEAIRSGRSIDKIYMAAGAEGSVVKIRAMARDAGIPVETLPRMVLDRMTGNGRHQGVAAEGAAHEYSSVEVILENARVKGEDPLIVILDEINDPHNLGAIIRTAECAGAHGVIIPKRNACGLTQTVARASAGAIETMPVARVTNLARTLEELRGEGIWVAAIDMDGATYYEQEHELGGPLAVVIGGEGHGIGRLVKEGCDFVLSLPMRGSINSLNASNAAAVILYGIRRARDTKQGI